MFAGKSEKRGIRNSQTNERRSNRPQSITYHSNPQCLWLRYCHPTRRTRTVSSSFCCISAENSGSLRPRVSSTLFLQRTATVTGADEQEGQMHGVLRTLVHPAQERDRCDGHLEMRTTKSAQQVPVEKKENTRGSRVNMPISRGATPDLKEDTIVDGGVECGVGFPVTGHH